MISMSPINFQQRTSSENNIKYYNEDPFKNLIGNFRFTKKPFYPTEEAIKTAQQKRQAQQQLEQITDRVKKGEIIPNFKTPVEIVRGLSAAIEAGKFPFLKRSYRR